MDCKQALQQVERLSQPAQASPELAAHTAHCDRCAKFIAERTALHRALANLRAETATLGPSLHVEQQVLAALNATSFHPRRTRDAAGWMTRRWMTVSALVFATLLVAAILFPRSTHDAAPPVAEIPHEAPFIAMPYVPPPAPSEHTFVIRTQISSQMLQVADPQIRDAPGSTTLADVVLGEDGRMVAFRPVSHSNPVSPKRIN